MTGDLPVNSSMTEQQVTQAINNGIPRQQAESIKTPLGDFVSILLRRRQEYRFKKVLDAWEHLKGL
jgi:hypothetical protein